LSTREEDRVKTVMSSPVITMESKGNFGSAAKIMVKNEIGSVVVVERKKPVGMVTERDITKQVIKGTGVLKKPVKSLLTKALVTAPPDMPVQEALELMLMNKIRRLPVLENDNLVGIVTEKDLMRWVLRVSYEPKVPKHIQMVLNAK